MSFLRALRAYIGLGPDEDIEDRYLYELNSRRRELDLDDLEVEDTHLAQGLDSLEIESDEVVVVTPGRRRANSGADRTSRPARPSDSSRSRAERSRPRRSHFAMEDQEPEPPARGKRRARPEGRRLPASEFIDDFDLEEELGLVGSADEVGEMESAGGLDVVEHESGLEDESLEFTDDDLPLSADAANADSSNASIDLRDQEADADDSYPRAVVRSLDSMRAKPRTLIPESFADAKLVADEFKRDIPVLLNLQSLDRDLARRLIDFASGICYAMDGSMEKIASQVFLLVPESVEVSDEDRRRIEERGYAR